MDEPVTEPVRAVPVTLTDTPLSYRTQQAVGRLRIERSADCTVITVLPRWSTGIMLVSSLAMQLVWLAPVFLSNPKWFSRPEPIAFVFIGIAVFGWMFQVASSVLSRLSPQRFEIRSDGITERRRTLKSIEQGTTPEVLLMYFAIEKVRDRAWPLAYEAVVAHLVTGMHIIVFSGRKVEKEAFLHELLERIPRPEPSFVGTFPADPCDMSRARAILPDGFTVTVEPRKFRWGSIALAVLICTPLCMFLATTLCTSKVGFIPNGKNAEIAWVFAPIFTILAVLAACMIQYKLSRTTHFTVQGDEISLIEHSVIRPCNANWPVSLLDSFQVIAKPRVLRLMMRDGQVIDLLSRQPKRVIEWVCEHLNVELQLRRRQAEVRASL